MNDPEPCVRIALAQRLTGEALAALFGDPEYAIRLAAARRAEPALLVRLMDDVDPSVRREVAAWRILEEKGLDHGVGMRVHERRRPVEGRRVRARQSIPTITLDALMTA